MKIRIFKILFFSIPWCIAFYFMIGNRIERYKMSLKEDGFNAAISAIGEGALKNGNVTLTFGENKKVNLTLLPESLPK